MEHSIQMTNTIEAKTVAGVTFSSTGGGYVDEAEIPTDDFESHYLFDGENKSTSVYPVVDADDVLRKSSVRSARSSGSEDEVDESKLRSKVRSLADEFDPPLELTNMSDGDSEEDGEANEIEAKSVAGVTFTDTKNGKLERKRIPSDDYRSHYLYPADTKGDSTYPVVDADGNLRRGNVSSAHELGARGGVDEDTHESKLRKLAKEFDPEIGEILNDEGEAELTEGRLSSAGIGHEGEQLRGTIWASGTHSLSLNGNPTRVHVPPETIKPTFDSLKRRVEAGDAGIGFDHPSGGSVAADTVVGDIGRVESVSLDASEEKIVMTESEVTNNKAEQAIAAGEFDGFDYSIVGKFGTAGASDDELKDRNVDAVLSTVRVERVDVVPNGAVSIANVNRNVPTLAAELSGIQSGRNRPIAEYASDIRAAVGNEHNTRTDMFNTNPEDIEAAKSELSDAADVLEEKEEEVEGLEAEKSELKEKMSDLDAYREAFEEIASAFGLQQKLEEDGIEEVTASAVDNVTEDVRREIAELEASLPGESTSSDEIEDRTEELAGTDADTLEARAGRLARDFRKAATAKSNRSNAIVSGEAGEMLVSDDEPDEELVSMADEALDPIEAMEAEEQGIDAAAYIEQEYGGIDPSEFDSQTSLEAKMSEYRQNGGGN